MGTTTRVRCWVLTEHNLKHFRLWKSTPKAEAVRYLTYQLESAKTGKNHIQGYVEFYNPVSLKSLKQHLGTKTVHAEPRAGSRNEARDYCHKDDSPWFHIHYPHWSDHGGRISGSEIVEIGTWDTKQGNRSDLDRVYDLVYSGSSEIDIFNKCPREYLKYHSGIRRARHLRTLHLCDKYHKVEVHVLHGGSRTGKTRHVMETHGHENVYKPVWNGQKYWFTDYDGEDVLLLDEFYGQMRPHEIQTLLDNYHQRLEAKGSNPISQWSKVYITSNVHPSAWWNSFNNIPHSVEDSIINRIKTVRFFSQQPGEKKTWDSFNIAREDVDCQYYQSTSGTLPQPSFLQNTKDGSQEMGQIPPKFFYQGKVAPAKISRRNRRKNRQKGSKQIRQKARHESNSLFVRAVLS